MMMTIQIKSKIEVKRPICKSRRICVDNIQEITRNDTILRKCKEKTMTFMMFSNLAQEEVSFQLRRKCLLSGNQGEYSWITYKRWEKEWWSLTENNRKEKYL